MPPYKKVPARHNSSSTNSRSGQPYRADAGAPKAGSRSPKHRGHRPDTDGGPAKKARWNAAERRERQGNAARTQGSARQNAGDGRRDWYPKGERPVGRGGSRPQYGKGRVGGNDSRPQRDEPRSGRQNDRGQSDYAPRYGRDERAPRYERDERARYDRGQSERAPRYDRDERSARYGRDARAPRYGRDGRPREERSPYQRTERPRYEGDGRQGGYRDDRSGRADRAPRYKPDERPRYDRSDRKPRDDRYERNDRGDRPGRGATASGRPRRSEDGNRHDRDHRNERADRGYSRGAREPQGRRSDFAPSRAPQHTVDDVVLERLEAQAVDVSAAEGLTFDELGLGQNIVRVLAELGAEMPFPIQSATIPEILTGKDVLGRGRTGSGKTIAFGAPLAELLLRGNNPKARRAVGRRPRALILAPTRELALQIDRTVQPIARSVGLFTTQIYGGVPQARQVGALQRGVDIIVGTPGRIEDLINQGRLDLSAIEIVVLDEADHMCDLGFLEPVQRLIRQTKEDGQRLLFSATLDSGVAALVEEFLREPSVYEVAGEDQDSSTIEHRVFQVEQRDKIAIVEKLVERDGKTLVFARTRAFAEQLADILDDAGIPAVSLHGDLNQARRTRNLEKLSNGRARVLVATDVAARGIHIDDITLVVQADIPEDYKTYLHRSGRTGRAGRQGTVVTLVTKPRLRKINDLLRNAEIKAEIESVSPRSAVVASL